MPKLQRAKTVACGLLRWDRCCIIVVSHWSKPAGQNMASLLVVVGFRTSHSMPKEESHVIFSKNLPLKAHRDPVGTREPPAKPTKCLGAGTLDLDAGGLTQSAIAQVECPRCGAVRTVPLKAQRVVFPAHAPLKTHTTCKGARWIRGETGWALAQP